MCSDWESNPQPFGMWDNIQPTKPHEPGPCPFLKGYKPREINTSNVMVNEIKLQHYPSTAERLASNDRI